jgi:hypothetical protein
MKPVQVSGRFIDEQGVPLEGECKFIPSRIWVEEGEETYPTLAPEVRLVHGRVLVYLTRTDQEELDWYYTVVCPAGTMIIRIEDDGPLKLKDLLPNRYA